MTSTQIADALITMLASASVLGVGMVKKNDFSILETSASSCAVISWSGLNSTAISFGNDRERKLTMKVGIFVREVSNPTETLDNVYLASESVVACLESDDTLQGTVSMVDVIRATRNENDFLDVGGVTWLPVEVLIEVTEL
jgi:hypothetical protein